MRGHLHWRAGAWRLVVDAGRDPVTGRRKQVHRTVREPQTRTGRRRAESELAKLVVEVEAGRSAPRSGLTVDEVVERWLRDRSPGWSPGQADAVRRRVERHVSPHLGDVPVDRLRPVDVTSWHGKLRAVGLAESTISREHSILSAALAWAEDHELIARNPAARRAPRAPRPEIDPPGPDDVRRLIDAAPDDLGLFVRLAALTGARRGQICALQWRDLDLDAGTVRWARVVVKVPGGTEVKEGSKTGARYAVALDRQTVDLLRAERRRAAERALAVGVSLEPDAFVFSVDPAGRQSWHPDGASQRFAALRERVGLDGIRLHDLRHYLATQMLGAGVDVQTLAGRGGWSDSTTPLQVYAHFLPARDVDAARLLAERLDGTG